MHWYLEVFSKFSDFSGRSRRSEYWMFTLIHWCILLSLYIWFFSGGDNPSMTPLIIAVLYLLVGVIPALAVTIRRLHDTGRSGAWFLISFIPFVGPIILLVFLASDGEVGSNRYGPSPKFDAQAVSATL